MPRTTLPKMPREWNPPPEEGSSSNSDDDDADHHHCSLLQSRRPLTGAVSGGRVIGAALASATEPSARPVRMPREWNPPPEEGSSSNSDDDDADHHQRSPLQSHRPLTGEGSGEEDEEFWTRRPQTSRRMRMPRTGYVQPSLSPRGV